MFGKNEIVGQKFFKEAAADKLFVTSMFMTLQGEGPYRGEPAFFIRLAKCNLNCHFCFVGNTKITMADGKQKMIKDVAVGDSVVSYDETTNQFLKKTVSKVYKSTTDKLLRVNTTEPETDCGSTYNSSNSSQKLFCTPEHPFLVKNKGWVEARNLQKDDVILEFSISERMKMFNPRLDPVVNQIKQTVSEFINNGSIVHSVDLIDKGSDKAWVRLAGSKDLDCEVYNLEVEDTHTYVANGKIVHNCDTFFDDGEWMTFQEIDAAIEKTISDYFKNGMPKYATHGYDETVLKRVFRMGQGYIDLPVTGPASRKMVLVITGGEPMLQKNLPAFLVEQEEKFQKIQSESNGTIVQPVPESVTLVVSPKCAEKAGVSTKYLSPKTEMLERADCLKFVMSADLESPYSTIPDWAHSWHERTGKPIFISPMNIYNSEPQRSKELRSTTNHISLEDRSNIDEKISFWDPGLLNMTDNQKNHEYAARYCVDHGYTFNMQQHLFASMA